MSGKELLHLKRGWDISLHIVSNSPVSWNRTRPPCGGTGGSYCVWLPYEAARSGFSSAPVLDMEKTISNLQSYIWTSLTKI